MSIDSAHAEPLSRPFDLLVIGGGVNGVGVARDGAGRGLRVALVEQADLAQATSSASSKLIHGGLRYLEQFALRLVHESLGERETLLRAAPHIIRPLRFVLPHHRALRPAWMLRAGLFLYDHLGARTLLAPSRAIDLRSSLKGAPLRSTFTRGFEYSDCWVDDARLVVLAALDAKERGAAIMTRTRFVSAAPDPHGWRAILAPSSGAPVTVHARAIVNAAGPWVGDALSRIEGANQAKRAHLRLVQGSHIVTRKLFDGEHAYIFQNADGRILFAIPYERDYTLLGTTDTPFAGDAYKAAASTEEIDYLLAMASAYFTRAVTYADIVHTYSGVRALYDESSAKRASAVTRDYVLDLDTAPGRGALVCVYGGKITTFRKLAEHVIDALAPHLHLTRPAWTAHAPLPGGDIAEADFAGFFDDAQGAYPWLDAHAALRLARAYGTRIHVLLDGARGPHDMGDAFEGGLTAREVEYLIAHEWAMSAEDILWRRTKIGLHIGGDAPKLARFLSARAGAAHAAP